MRREWYSQGHCVCSESEAHVRQVEGGTRATSGKAKDSEPELLPTEVASTIVDRRVLLRLLQLQAAQQIKSSAPAIAEDNAIALNSRGEKPAPGGIGVPVLELVTAAMG